MDLTTTTKTSDPTENETPPHPLSIKSKSFTNGSSLHHHPPPPTVTFKECLKNHAASLGAHALDGCGEFMQSPTATPTDPTSLTCAACGCHRNFHRRESDNPTAATHFLDFRRCRSSPSPSPSPPPLPYAPHMLLALRTAAAPEDHHHHQQQAVATPATPTALKAENSSGRKRFRTKFSQEQKDKMLSFAEKLGWKMQKCDEDLVEKFCNEIGIGKGVLKVWLHNNKSTLGKRSDTINNNSNGRVNSFDDNNVNCDDHQPQNEISGSGVTVDHRHLHVSTNGSSSSS